MIRVLLGALLLVGSGCGEEAPEPDAGPPDAGDAGPPANVYEGTCFQPLVDCFDLSIPCTQMDLAGMPGFTATGDNGAMLTVNLAEGTQLAINSRGDQCWTSSVDSATEDTVYETPSGSFRERVVGSQRRITCSDGTEQTGPAGPSPWENAVNDCDFSGG